MNIITEPSGYYFCAGRVYIISDGPKAAELIAKCPDIPAKPLAELEAMRNEK
jgi:hypothetical protein